LGGKLICPYCYEKFAEKEITFRCGGLRAADGKQCQPERDPVRERFNDTSPVPPEVAGDGRKLSALCGRCGNETTLQICPVVLSVLTMAIVLTMVAVMLGGLSTGDGTPPATTGY
jgi:hypothetical protein